MEHTLEHTCDICDWTNSIYTYLDYKDLKYGQTIFKKEKELFDNKMKNYLDLTKYTTNTYTKYFFYDSYIRIFFFLSTLETSDSFHINLLSIFFKKIYDSQAFLYNINIENFFISMLCIESELPNERDIIYSLYTHIWNLMSKENKNNLEFRKILNYVKKLSTIKFLLEELKIEYKLETKLTNKTSLNFKDIFFNLRKNKSDIVNYILNKNKEIYPTKLEETINGHVTDIKIIEKILNFSKTRGWSLLITKKDLDKLNWWYNSELINYLSVLYQKQNIEKILLMKLVFSKFPEELERKIMDYMY